jgi:hypothetical protein
MRNDLPSTVASASIFAIAAITSFSMHVCVRRMMSVCFSPSEGSFWIIALIEISRSARMRVMSASTPGLSCTRIRR